MYNKKNREMPNDQEVVKEVVELPDHIIKKINESQKEFEKISNPKKNKKKKKD